SLAQRMDDVAPRAVAAAVQAGGLARGDAVAPLGVVLITGEVGVIGGTGQPIADDEVRQLVGSRYLGVMHRKGRIAVEPLLLQGAYRLASSTGAQALRGVADSPVHANQLCAVVGATAGILLADLELKDGEETSLACIGDGLGVVGLGQRMHIVAVVGVPGDVA